MDKRDVVLVSLFDGIGGAAVAAQRAGLNIVGYYSSEIDPYAISVTRHHFPQIRELGDVKQVDGAILGEQIRREFPNVPILLIGGSPCQSFSFSGKQLGFKDERGRLFFEFYRIFKQLKPEYVVMENVEMKKEFKEAITEQWGFGYTTINSNLVSAQNRKRLYWTAKKDGDVHVHVPISQPEDRQIFWGDVRENGVNSNKYYYTEKAMQWLGRHSRSKNKLLRVCSEDEKKQTIEASRHKKYSAQRFFGIIDVPTDEEAVAAMRGRYLVDNKRQDGKMKTAGLTKQYIEFRYDGKTNALTTVSKDNVVVPFTAPNRIPADEFFFRYITPLECERLQTYDDEYTLVPHKSKMMSDSRRYRLLGNSFTVDVVAHILRDML